MASGVSRATTAAKEEQSEAAPVYVEEAPLPAHTGQFLAFGTGPVLEVERMSGDGRDTGYVQEENRPAPTSQEDSSVLEA